MAAYRLWLGQWEASAAISDPESVPNGGMTVLAFGTLYSDHAARIFRIAGEPTSHAERVRSTLERLANHEVQRDARAGLVPLDHRAVPAGVKRFPLGLAAVSAVTTPLLAQFRDAAEYRQDGEKRARASINDMLQVLREAFRWGVEQGYVPGGVFEAATTTGNLKRGRTNAREKRKVESVSRDRVDAVLPFCTAPAADLIQILWLTGMRPTEACSLRGDRIDMTDPEFWLYAPERYKGQHLDDDATRIVAIGTEAQAIIRPYLTATGKVGDYLIRPVGPRTKLPRYTANSLRLNISRACRKAGIQPWTTHQLRHAAATSLYAEHGHDAAAAILGHRGDAPPVTLAYVDAAVLTAERAARAIALARRFTLAS